MAGLDRCFLAGENAEGSKHPAAKPEKKPSQSLKGKKKVPGRSK